MKKNLLVLLMLGFGVFARAQSINLLNLTNLTSLNNKQIADDLAARKVFKLQSGEDVGGFQVETYQSTAPRNKLETLVVGKGFKLASGGVLHTVTYISADPQNVINLMGQIRSINVKQSFHGADQYDNIYIFDGVLYRIVVRVSFDGSRSTVDISQKQVIVE